MSRLYLPISSSLVVLGALLLVYTYLFDRPEVLQEVAFWIIGLSICLVVFFYLWERKPSKEEIKGKTLESMLEEGAKENREKVVKIGMLGSKNERER